MAKEEKQKGSSSVSQRRRRGQPQEPSNKDEYLYDETEQDEQIHTLEKDIGRMATRSRLITLSIGIPLTCLYLAFAGIQLIRPWSLLHHRIFKEPMEAMYGESSTKSIASLAIGDVASALAMSTSTLSVNQFIQPVRSVFLPTWKNAVNLSVAMMLLQLIYWSFATYALIQKLSVTDLGSVWRVVWKPIIPLFWFITATFIIDSISKLQIDIATLKRLKYRYKKL